MVFLGLALVIVVLVVAVRSVMPRTSNDSIDYSNEPDCLDDDAANYDPASDTEPEGR